MFLSLNSEKSYLKGRSQNPLEATMIVVPPGYDTGIYYIMVANLPRSCSRQQLKGFTRNPQADGTSINVDQAMIYPNSIGGWVRVKGEHDFIKAIGKRIFPLVIIDTNTSIAHLDGGIFEHRALIADGNNKTKWIGLGFSPISCG